VIFVKNTETVCPQRDSILGPLAPQASMLPLDHCDLLPSILHDARFLNFACFSLLKLLANKPIIHPYSLSQLSQCQTQYTQSLPSNALEVMPSMAATADLAVE